VFLSLPTRASLRVARLDLYLLLNEAGGGANAVVGFSFARFATRPPADSVALFAPASI
jgi:hypothetical protein